MTARSQAKTRRKATAASRQRSTKKRRPSQGRALNVKRKQAKDGRKNPSEAQKAPAKGSRLDRLRGRLNRLSRRRAKTETAKASSAARAQSAGREDPPRTWPRRLGVVALKLGTTVAVAWGLLIAGREVYEYATTSARFEVQHFIYEPTAHLDDDELRELLAIEPGTNILACDLAQLSERVAEHPWVAMATLTRNLPDTLEISIVEHEPEAIVLAGRFYLVNAEGRPFKVVERGDRGELPIITGISREALAEAAEEPVPELADAIELIHLYASKQRPRLGELHLGEDESLTLYTAEAGTQLRLGRTEFAERLERWDALRAALGDRADRLAVVHLDHESKPDRRDRVVARFANERDEALILAAGAEGLLAQAETAEGAGERGPEPKRRSKKQSNKRGAAAEAAPAQAPARRAGRRNRIPSYE